jgi:hypothetical protein
MLEKTPVVTILFAVSLPAVIRKNQRLELSVKYGKHSTSELGHTEGEIQKKTCKKYISIQAG